MNKQFFAVVVVIILGLVGVLFITKDKGTDGGANSSTANVQPSEHVVGKADSKVTLTEYGDFQCPACKSYFPIVAQVKEEYKDKIKFQFRHFPLTQIHPNAFIGSRAAEAAGKQGKFFEMHDLLYENQDTWSASQSPQKDLEGYAQQLNLNLDQFKTDLNGSELANIINADTKAGQAIGANSTPTFAINGKKIENPKSLDEFKKALDDALAQNQ